MVLQVLDPDGKQVSGESADEGDTDPLLMVKLPVTGRYTVRIQELELQQLTGGWRLAILAWSPERCHSRSKLAAKHGRVAGLESA